MDLTLSASALASSVAAGIFLAAGVNLLERRVRPEAADALRLFSLWWVALALYALAGASADLTAALGVQRVEVFLVLSYVQMIAFCLGLWGLVYYLVYVLTGRRRWRAPLAVAHALYFGALLFLVTLGRPAGVMLREASVHLLFATPAVDGSLLTLLLVLPAMAASVTYLGFLVFARHPSQRLRVVLVTGGTLAWLLAIVSGEGPLASVSSPLPPVLALVSAWCITWAYHPPRWLRERLGSDDANAISGGAH